MTCKQIALLLLITSGAILVHGYHPAVEDGEIYLPGIKKALNPTLYPAGEEFFMSHARMTLFDQVVAGSIRISHVPFDYAIFLWHFACVFLLLWGCWRVGRKCFNHAWAPWGGTALVAALLTIPVAGTALYIMDPYLTTRDLSTAGILVAVANAVERKFLRCGIWLALAALIHPLMPVFGIALCAILYFEERRLALPVKRPMAGTGLALFFPVVFSMRAASPAYQRALDTRSYFFLLRWKWYEWLGIFAPLAILWFISRYGKKRGLRELEALSRALIVFGLIFFAAALILTVPRRFASLALLQPMRSLHLIFTLMFVLLGGLLVESFLKRCLWRWLVFAPVCLGMFLVQRQLCPATEHLELPGLTPHNEWVQAFDWIRYNTPRDAVFALDPQYMVLPGEDQHGFRALAERSRLADAVKDSGAVSMFPLLADRWLKEVQAQQDWKNFQLSDFQRLRRDYGVSWVVLQQPGVAGLPCPYRNPAVQVCRVD
ncbi:MAG: DUF6798 domain-containing protein [Bryobacteraceae bacterium]